MLRPMTGILLLVVIMTGYGCLPLRITLPPGLSANEWRMTGGDPQRTNASRDSLVLPLVLRWSYDASAGFGPSSVAVTDSILFVSTLHGEILAVRTRTGEGAGSRRFGPSIVGAPVLDGSMLYTTIAGDENSLVAFDVTEGRIRWTIRMGGSETSPLLIGDRIFFCTLNGKLVCAGKKTGEVLWTYSPPKHLPVTSIHSSPAGDGTIVVFGSDDGRLTAVGAADGVLRWSFRARRSILTSPIITGGRVIAGSLDSSMYAVDASTGSLLWSRPLGSAIYSSAAVGGNRVYAGTSGRQLCCLSIDSGEILWSFDMKGPVGAAPVVSGNVVFAGSLDKTIYALDGISGKILWHYETGGRIKTSPVVAKQSLFILTDDRVVQAFVHPDR
jgi:eukaryotic-like serine/threonine-protein kinase